jgi:hypothetical protein
MHHEDLRSLLEAQPFRPFRVTLSNDRTRDIRHPEFAGLTHRLLTISAPAADENAPADEKQVGAAVVHNVQYEFLPPRAPAAAS